MCATLHCDPDVALSELHVWASERAKLRRLAEVAERSCEELVSQTRDSAVQPHELPQGTPLCKCSRVGFVGWWLVGVSLRSL